MFFLLYNFLIWLLTLFFLPVLLIRMKRGGAKSIAKFLGFSREEIAGLGTKNILWIQAVSVGETLVAARLLEEIKKVFPGWKIVFTCTTGTGFATARKALAGLADLLGFFPFDHPWVVRRFYNRLRPRLLLLTEGEFWPNVLREAKKRGVGTALVNGRLSDRSYQRMKWRGVFAPVLRLVDLFCVRTEQDAARFAEAGVAPDRLKVTGNIKFDQNYREIPEDERREFLAQLGITEETPVLTAASTHRGEEEIVLRAFLEIKKQFPTAFLILAPRHPERAEEVERLLAVHGVKWVRRSRLTEGKNRYRPEVLLLDTLGELGLAYSLSRISFVGGSLVPVGGHNVLEAAAQGKPVFYGPYMHNFHDSKELLEEAGAGVTVGNARELAEKFLRYAPDRNFLAEAGRKARQVVEANRGAACRTAKILQDYFTRRMSKEGGV